ncbi:MAG: serine hydrolase [Armatimonadota bacterium]
MDARIAAFDAHCRNWEGELAGGVLGLAIQLPDGMGSLSYRATETFPTASVIKVAIVAELLIQSSEGLLDLRESVEIRAEDRVGGSGVLADLSGGISMPLGDLATLAITVSDNSASNACLRAVGGVGAVNKRLAGWGIDSVKVHRPILFQLGADDPPFTATGDPRGLLALLAHVPPTLRERMGLCQDDSMLGRGLDLRPWADILGSAPGSIRLSHKTGAVEGVRNDMGWIVGPAGSVAVAAMVRCCADTRWTVDNRACVVLGHVGAWLAGFVSVEEAIEG